MKEIDELYENGNLTILNKDNALQAASSAELSTLSQINEKDPVIKVFYLANLARSIAMATGFEQLIPLKKHIEGGYDRATTFYIKESAPMQQIGKEKLITEKAGQALEDVVAETHFDLIGSDRDTIVYAKNLSEKGIVAAMAVYGNCRIDPYKRFEMATKLNDKGLTKGSIALKEINEDYKIKVSSAIKLNEKYTIYADGGCEIEIGEY